METRVPFGSVLTMLDVFLPEYGRNFGQIGVGEDLQGEGGCIEIKSERNEVIIREY